MNQQRAVLVKEHELGDHGEDDIGLGLVRNVWEYDRGRRAVKGGGGM